MWLIRTSNPITITTINTSSLTVATLNYGSTYDNLHTILQLTTFGPWKRVDSPPHPLGQYRDPNPMPSCAPPARDGRAAAPLTPLPCWLVDRSSVRIFSLRYMRYKALRSSAQTACDSL